MISNTMHQKVFRRMIRKKRSQRGAAAGATAQWARGDMAYTPYTYTRCASPMVRRETSAEVPSAPEILPSVLNAAYKFPFKSMRQKGQYASTYLPKLAR